MFENKQSGRTKIFIVAVAMIVFILCIVVIPLFTRDSGWGGFIAFFALPIALPLMVVAGFLVVKMGNTIEHRFENEGNGKRSVLTPVFILLLAIALFLFFGVATGSFYL